MDVCNSNQNEFNPNIEMFRFIAYGYIKNNYSRKFYKNLEYHLVNSSIKESKCVAIVFLRGCGEFKLEIDLNNKTIKHSGDYQKNRNYPLDKIIDLAIKKYKTP
ncbi:hypothetical protein [Chryseobacterium sp.]|uniref:hypothetical protein n=1 Tax=Chryseobacterium sp. TaxID=1871047 RepID=UPI00289F5806|nr:hypothetical protein [Chryseobacterium sp.]